MCHIINEQCAKEYIPESESELCELYGKTVRGLIDAGITLSSAESCTGGLIGKLITDVPGSSAVYMGGIISYTNEVKMNVLGVKAQSIEKYTEVSDIVAGEMADMARIITNSCIGVSTTGFAGPGGGTAENPVGTVYIGLSDGNSTSVFRLCFPTDATREQIRSGAACFIAHKLSILI